MTLQSKGKIQGKLLNWYVAPINIEILIQVLFWEKNDLLTFSGKTIVNDMYLFTKDWIILTPYFQKTSLGFVVIFTIMLHLVQRNFIFIKSFGIDIFGIFSLQVVVNNIDSWSKTQW